MRKFYIGLLIGLTIIIGETASAEESSDLINSFTLYDLTHDRMNADYTDSKGNTIRVSTNEPTIGNGRLTYFSDIENPLQCASETTEGLQPPLNGMYTRFLLMGAGNTRPNRSPYFIIDLGSTTSGIKEIQLMGTASGSNEGEYEELMYAFSPVSNPEVKNSFVLSTDFEELPNDYEPLQFIVGDCNYNNLRIKIPEGMASVIFISTDEFGGWATNTLYSNPAEFHALRFFAEDEGNPTSIEEQENDLSIKQLNNKIYCNQKADFHIYSLEGKLILHVKDKEAVDMDGYNHGIYIVKARINETTTTKKVVIK